MKRAGLIVGLSVALASSPARGDVVMLKGGGQVRGKVIADPAAKEEGRVLVVLPMGKTPLSVPENQILRVVPKPGPLDEYATRREDLAPTARGEYDLGAWCEAHELPDLAEVHYESALKRDPDFAPAREKLGHVRDDGHWLTPDQQRREAGMVLSRGEWMTAEEKNQEDEEARESAETASWLRRVKAIVRGLDSESADRRREAEDELMAIREPAAVGPLLKGMGERDAEFRILLARALGGIPGDASSAALVRMILREPSERVRTAILEALRPRGEDVIAARLTRGLRSRDVRVVNRAAWALGNLDVFAAVPRLLKVLVTTEERVVMVPSGGPAYRAAGPPGPLMAYNGSSAAYMLGPVVGPGVAAYGGVVVPNTFILNPYNGGGPIGPGAGFVGADLGPRPALASFTTRNAEVRGALNRLTGQDFGYDVAAWRRWVARSFNPKPEPDRKVPQP